MSTYNIANSKAQTQRKASLDMKLNKHKHKTKSADKGSNYTQHLPTFIVCGETN
ncbi:MAG: hypothetical protein Q3992_06270 [Bacteroides sp.]|nr:hypothetical protein [Bacteroides sp.]